MIIGLTGHYGSGKDAAGAVLVARGFRRIAFADEVRKEVELSLVGGWPRETPWRIRLSFAFDWLRGIDGCDIAAEIWTKPTSPRMRRLLQWWGTEYRRAQSPDYWVRKIHALLIGGGRSTVITDTRFADEVDLVHEFGGQVWRIVRAGQDGDAHASEVGIDALEADLVIYNDGTLQDLAEEVRACLSKIA